VGKRGKLGKKKKDIGTGQSRRELLIGIRGGGGGGRGGGGGGGVGGWGGGVVKGGGHRANAPARRAAGSDGCAVEGERPKSCVGAANNKWSGKGSWGGLSEVGGGGGGGVEERERAVCFFSRLRRQTKTKRLWFGGLKTNGRNN